MHEAAADEWRGRKDERNPGIPSERVCGSRGTQTYHGAAILGIVEFKQRSWLGMMVYIHPSGTKDLKVMAWARV